MTPHRSGDGPHIMGEICSAKMNGWYFDKKFVFINYNLLPKCVCPRRKSSIPMYCPFPSPPYWSVQELSTWNGIWKDRIDLNESVVRFGGSCTAYKKGWGWPKIILIILSLYEMLHHIASCFVVSQGTKQCVVNKPISHFALWPVCLNLVVCDWTPPPPNTLTN